MTIDLDSVRYLLLQVRNEDDPMRHHEVHCFARSLRCEETHIEVVDLLNGRPHKQEIVRADVVLLGGSGDYSVAAGGDWLPQALDAMRELVEESKPTFASCWGFQAMARAMGGQVVTDTSRAEVGTHEVYLTAEGIDDPVFGPLGHSFLAQMGHQDIVNSIPQAAVCLASSELVTHQAFRVRDKPIYCTQFHPELELEDLLTRLRIYPRYVESIAGMPFAELVKTCGQSPDTTLLLERFVRTVLA